MRGRTAIAVAVGMLLALATAGAGDKPETVTLEGSVACAKCSLGVEDAKQCQNVLVVETKGQADPTYYYLTKNDVSATLGEVCHDSKAAVITGSVQEKDGKMWLTATKIEPATKA
jgi:hypothetical protein